MIVYGASGHGKVIIEILESMHTPHIEIWDDADREPVWGYSVKRPLPAGTPIVDKMVISIGVNETRKKVAERVGSLVSFGTAIHTTACVSKRAAVGEGSVVMAGVTINADTNI